MLRKDTYQKYCVGACGFVQPWEIAKPQKVPENHQTITRESLQFPL